MAETKKSQTAQKRSRKVKPPVGATLFDGLEEVTERKSATSSSKSKRKKGSESRARRSSARPRQTKLHAHYATAEVLAGRLREISISEFFAKNRHLLGFDNPKKALLTTIKEAVDNSLDACEEAGILPDVSVIVRQVGDDRFQVTVEDNGPGILKSQIPNVFGKLLYGSKFHHLRMSRGQQGIGISAAGMYGLLTTGRPIRVTSRTSPKRPAHYYELQIDTKKNRPDIIKDDEVEFECDHGTRVVIELEARYQRGRTSIDEYLRQTAIANPHVHLNYVPPDDSLVEFKRTSKELPPQAKTIKPHPHGVELGVLIKMLRDTDNKTLHAFLTNDFSRVSARVATEIIKKAKLAPRVRSSRIGRTEADRLFGAIKQVKIMAPATNCVVPIGDQNLLKGLQAVVKAEFYAAHTRPPMVYRGNPFVIETALAYGKPLANGPEDDELELGKLDAQIDLGADESGLVRLFRLANRVPLLYQQSGCAAYKAMVATNWRNYGLSQSRGAMPVGPVVIIIHMASVWVPFTSESKEAIAHYPEIIREMKLAIQECGRKLGKHLRREKRHRDELKKRSYIEKYIPHIGIALRDILDLPGRKTDKVVDNLKDILQRSRKL